MPLDVFAARQAAYRAELTAALARLPDQPPPLTLELGCGHGHFLTAFAQAHPAALCLGVDLLADRIARAERKRTRAGLTNLLFVQGEASLFFSCLPAHFTFAATYLLFPDPWPKTRHHKHRLLSPSLLTAVAARTAPGGHLYFRTDHAPYFEAALAVFAPQLDWKLAPPGTPWPFEHPTVFQERATAGFQSLTAVRA